MEKRNNIHKMSRKSDMKIDFKMNIYIIVVKTEQKNGIEENVQRYHRKINKFS